MQFKKFTLMTIFITLLTHSTIAPMFRFQTTHGPEYQQQFEKYMSWEQDNVLWNTGIIGGIVGIILALNYLSLLHCNHIPITNINQLFHLH